MVTKTGVALHVSSIWGICLPRSHAHRRQSSKALELDISSLENSSDQQLHCGDPPARSAALVSRLGCAQSDMTAVVLVREIVGLLRVVVIPENLAYFHCRRQFP